MFALAFARAFLGFFACLLFAELFDAFAWLASAVEVAPLLLDGCVKFEFSMNRLARDGMKTFFDTMQITKRMSSVYVLEKDDILAPIEVSK